ncbi:MAG: alpha/beta hydrolase [Candidatus Zixiibacteriota bacterium]|nr:MAG: alpha/beta hydrolase [candidate division Zixibacteria bacterium]
MPAFRFKDLELCYRRHGTGDIALLFIHGLGGGGDSWKHQRDYFADRYEVITLDLFGHGTSSGDVDPVFAARIDAEAIDNLMQEEILKPFFAIGHSFASATISEMIKLRNPLLQGIVFVDCVYQGFDDIIQARVTFGSQMLAYTDEQLKAKAEEWYLELIGNNAGAEDKAFIMSSLHRCNYRWLFKAVAGCREYNDRYPAFRIPIPADLPILIVEAEHGVGSNFRKSWVNHFKNAEYFLFDNAYHFFFVTERERFNRLIEEFFARNT